MALDFPAESLAPVQNRQAPHLPPHFALVQI